MATTTTSIIGTGGDYSTIQAWEDDCPANLVTNDEIWRGECKNETFTAGVTISGMTTDSTRYVELTTEAGASFRDHADAETNPLRYNASVGAAVQGGVSNSVNYTRVSNLQFTASGWVIGGSASYFTMDNCIVNATNDRAFSMNVSGGLITLRNTIFITDHGGSLSVVCQTGNFDIYNCLSVRPSNRTANGSSFYFWGSGTTLNLRNCGGFGHTVFLDNPSASGVSASYNASDNTISNGSNNQASLTYADQFENTSSASGTHDFRTKVGAALIDNGTNLSGSGVTEDIIGTARPKNAGYDIGAWEIQMSDVKVFGGVTYANLKTVAGVAIANAKTISGIASRALVEVTVAFKNNILSRVETFRLN